MDEDIVRVLRVIEYVGPRKRVEETVKNSLHGEKRLGLGLVIRAATLGMFPEVLEQVAESKRQSDDGRDSAI